MECAGAFHSPGPEICVLPSAAQVGGGDTHLFAVLDDGAAGDGEAALGEGIHDGLVAQRAGRGSLRRPGRR